MDDLEKRLEAEGLDADVIAETFGMSKEQRQDEAKDLLTNHARNKSHLRKDFVANLNYYESLFTLFKIWQRKFNVANIVTFTLFNECLVKGGI